MATTPRLTLGLQNFRAQINRRFPDRDKTSDGWIGDTTHQQETSGHNPDDTPGSKAEWDGDPDSISEVRAVDVDANLNMPGVSTQQVIDHLRTLPGIGTVFRYIIFNRRIYHVNDEPAFSGSAYTGASPHIEHFHVSGARSQASDDNTTFDFKLDELGRTMDWTDDVIPVNDKKDTWQVAGTIGATYDRASAGLAQARSNGSTLSALSSNVSSLLSRPTVDPSSLAADVAARVLDGLANRAPEATAALLVQLLGEANARAVANAILAA